MEQNETYAHIVTSSSIKKAKFHRHLSLCLRYFHYFRDCCHRSASATRLVSSKEDRGLIVMLTAAKGYDANRLMAGYAREKTVLLLV